MRCASNGAHILLIVIPFVFLYNTPRNTITLPNIAGK